MSHYATRATRVLVTIVLRRMLHRSENPCKTMTKGQTKTTRHNGNTTPVREHVNQEPTLRPEYHLCSFDARASFGDSHFQPRHHHLVIIASLDDRTCCIRAQLLQP